MNNLLIERIVQLRPSHIRPRDYLMAKLGRSKESAYRRLRNQTVFTFEEAARIAADLGFSLDEIAGGKRLVSCPENSFEDMLRKYLACLHQLSSSREKPHLVSMNRLHVFFLSAYEHLFGFLYHRQLHHTGKSGVRTPFSGIPIPEEVRSLRSGIKEQIKTFHYVDFIIEENFFESFIREMNYFYIRKLLSEAEVETMKEELFRLLHRLESLSQNTGGEGIYNFYLSQLHVDNNCLCGFGKNGICSCFRIDSKEIQIIHNTQTLLHRKWMESQKKYAILISGSNEMLREEFIDKQREMIERNIGN
jgi:hypothetical protein